MQNYVSFICWKVRLYASYLRRNAIAYTIFNCQSFIFTEIGEFSTVEKKKNICVLETEKNVLVCDVFVS